MYHIRNHFLNYLKLVFFWCGGADETDFQFAEIKQEKNDWKKENAAASQRNAGQKKEDPWVDK